MKNTPPIGITLLFLMLVISLLNLVAFHSNYRRYYKRMKAVHNEVWRQLMFRDQFIEFGGEWMRWPYGSFPVFTSIFRKNIIEDDLIVNDCKRKARIYSLGFLLFLLVYFLLIAII